jgi:dTDP-4-dehydrorhamnose reductase
VKAIILGAAGQLGRELAATAPAAVTLVRLGRSDLDIVDAAAVKTVLRDERPDVVLNAAGYTGVDSAETESELAFAVNEAAVRHVADACAAAGTRLVHFSTDFVFDGSAHEPYLPGSPAMPLGAYGQSKLEGERAVLAALPEVGLIVRTSWLYSEHGHNFVKTMLRLIEKRDGLSVVGDQLGCPTWANGLARVVWRLLERAAPGGIYHWCDAGETSWYDFAAEIQKLAVELGLLGRSIPVERITTDQYPAPAKRPAYSVLNCDATVAATGCEQVPWQDNLRTMLEGMKKS